LQELHVTAPKKKFWPVVVCRGDLVWVRGFPVPRQWQPCDASQEAVLIQESAWPEDRFDGTAINETHNES